MAKFFRILPLPCNKTRARIPPQVGLPIFLSALPEPEQPFAKFSVQVTPGDDEQVQHYTGYADPKELLDAFVQGAYTFGR